MDFRRIFRLTPMVCAVLLAASPLQAHHKDRTLRLVCPSPIIISGTSDSGTAIVQLTNDGVEPVDLAPTTDDFTSVITGQGVGARITLTDENGKKLPEHKALKHGEFQLVKVSVENVWQPGESTLHFCNDGKIIGSLTAIKYHFPFAVSLDGAKSATPEIVAVQNRTMFLAFKNADALTYPVGWRLIVDGKKVGGGKLTLAPNATLSAPISPDPAWFPTGWVARPLSALKPRQADGRIEVCFRPDPSREHEEQQKAGDDDCDRAVAAGQGLYPAESIPVKVRLQYWPDKLQSFWGYAFIALVVLLGSLTSVLSSYGIPNVLSRLDLKEKLAFLGRRVTALSSAVDSRLRVQLGTQRQQIKDAMDSHFWFSPDQPETLRVSGCELNALDSRVALAEELDSIRQRYEALIARNMPPSLRSRADTMLQIAADLITNPRCKDVDLDKARGLAGEAADTLYKVRLAVVEGEGIADLLKDIDLACRLKEVKEDFEKLGLAGPDPVLQHFATLMQVVDDPPVTDPAQIRLLPHYVHQDFQILKLELLRDYAQLRAASGEANRGKLRSSEDHLLQLLDGDCWGDLQAAHLLLSGMQCGVYPSNLEDAVKSGKFSIVSDRPVVEKNQAVRFSIRFDKSELNGPAALEQLDYRWEFVHPSWDRSFISGIPSRWDGSWLQRLVRRRSQADPEGGERRHPRARKASDQIIEEGGKSVWFAWHYFPNAYTYLVRITISGPATARGAGEPSSVSAPPNAAQGLAGAPAGAVARSPQGQRSPAVEEDVWRYPTALDPKDRRSTWNDAQDWHWPFIREVVVKMEESKSMQRAGAELLRFLLAFGAALITLISGARTQIVKLDLAAAIVALWGMGFTSDAMKNLISQGPAASVASAKRVEPAGSPPASPGSAPTTPTPSTPGNRGPGTAGSGGNESAKPADNSGGSPKQTATDPAPDPAKPDSKGQAAQGTAGAAQGPAEWAKLSEKLTNFDLEKT